jgi:hypothetical protein
MINKVVTLGFIFTIFMLGLPSKSFSQTESDTYSIIHVYRVKESMMSGGRGLEAKMYLNNKEITSILTGTKLKYKIFSEGLIKMKFVAGFAGSGIGSPYVEELNIESGKEYHIGISVASMKGVSGEILNKKKLKKMSKKKFSDESELEEDKANPIVK